LPNLKSPIIYYAIHIAGNAKMNEIYYTCTKNREHAAKNRTHAADILRGTWPITVE